jgi:hypothetical protein
MASGVQYKIKLDKVVFDPGQPNLFIADPVGEVRNDLVRRMTRVAFESRKLVRVRTGRLLQSIRLEEGRSATGPWVQVVAGRPGINYTMFEHDGTAPHVIRARRKKALRFVLNGQVTFRTKVNHPGTTGTLFLTMALPYAAI